MKSLTTRSSLQGTEVTLMTDVKKNPNPAALDPQVRIQCIEDNLKMMRACFDVLFTENLNPMLSMFDQDIEWFIVPTGDTIKGKDEIAKLAANHWAASPGRIKTLVNLFADEEFACLEYRTSGTLINQADFPSITFQPTGKKYEFLCCFVFHIKNGKIDRVQEYFDMETVKRQLGTVDYRRPRYPGLTTLADVRSQFWVDEFLTGITPKMLVWWFSHLEGEIEVGVVY
jgi:ketosteroid isomerase-like protein